MNLRLEEYKDEDNTKYFKMPGVTPRKPEPTSEILVVAHDPNPIRMVIPINISTTVKEIKYQVLRHLPDIDESSIQLVYRSKILQDNDSVKNIGISNNDELTVLNVPVINSVNKDLPSDDLLPKIGNGYKTKPSLVEMARMTVEELRKVRNFTVENEFGKIVFEGETDVLGLNVAEIIKINLKEIVGYPDESSVEKPDIGKGLNKSAVLTLYQYDITGSKEKYEQKLKNVCQKSNMEYQSYNQANRELQVRIRHF